MRTLSAVVFAIALVAVAAGAPVAAAPAADTAPADPTCSFPVTETDATGTEVTVEERPERIVVLQPSAAQTVWELGAEDRVVGAPVVPYTSDLDGIEEAENVLQVDDFTVNQEAVVELDADLVLAPNIVPDDTVTSLREADQQVFKFGFGTSLSFVADKTALTGQLVDACDAAAEVNDDYWDRIDAVEERAAAVEDPHVMYFTDNHTAGSGTFIDDLITTAGGVNVAAEAGIDGYDEINEEALVEWNPDVIVASDAEPLPETAAYESTVAVEHGQVVTVDSNDVSQPAPRLVYALETIADGLADAETADRPTDATVDDQPGVGIAPAAAGLVLAVVAGLLVRTLRRR
ncbi:ABC-type transport system periplasmic substrate-binding protein (probable substrate cobalamin) [Natronomonas pharaonis DSM 2160]|uniref:ABC-type transport system periplasmic substrate-binding protein (Probable substrate cobalamin) n=1 Tax=Natronomonas pharaonis (strain ATCC 35678 / DSM 2160 / CIP 103997 / JCM 8858 / NBRC 14720 / NCIMB 2260 / Gabara) TaxID=348780 RepID=A0A1U7EXR6_NATPD|nr:PGF-CTERM-anchored ABC transporter substrate-binding protein [Natronomonas pharaonis]CAI49998.1 ABC-type transport system periplasmic substrate-binding protein (probable substrate cobalamin) [Natronomonas pharaonis DSM 2160]